MMDGQDEESPSPGALGDDCQESGVDGAEVVVLDAACDGNAIEAALLGGGLAEHMAELGAPVLRTPCHLKGAKGAREMGEVSQGESTPVMLFTLLHLPRKCTAEPQSTVWSDAFIKYEQSESEL